MDEEPFEKTLSEREPEEEGMEQSKEKRNSQSENITEAEPQQEPTALLDSPDANLTSAPVGLSSGEAHEGTKAAAGEPPVDWFEPLEDDDEANNWDFPGRGRHFNGRRDLEEESLAGESDKSWSVASSEKTVRKIYQYNIHSRKRSHPDEGWIEWPMLGEGWKRKEVVRRSGSSVGQKDVYYLSPRGERVRSRVELASVLAGITDLSTFEFKTGTFYNGDAPPPRRVRSKVKRKIRERSSSESSWMERGEGADTPDSHQRLTPNMAHKVGQSNQVGLFSYHVMDNTPNQGPQNEDTLREDKIKLPLTTSSRPLPSINGQIGSEETSLVCARCGISFTGTWYDKQRKKPSCPSCWASKTREHPMIRFRKWIPCGQCVACHNTVDCGQCANCKHGLQTPESRKRVCRKRKCICPIRKSSGSGSVLQQRSHIDIPETFEDNMSFQSEFTDSQHPSYKNSDIEDVNVDVEDDDDMSTDDDDNWHKKRKRRSCGKCTACLCRKDCGTCDFCIDKPKFGGSNKKRQKCRLRQCQRQAMLGQDEYGTQEGLVPVGRPRPHYTYSRKTSAKKSRGPSAGLDGSDNEDDSNVQQATNWSSEPSSGGKHSQNYKKQQSTQVNNSHTGQRNGVAGGVPNLSNNSSSQLVPEQPSRRDGERSDTGRDVEKHTGELEGELPMITQIFSLAKTETPAGSGVDTENQLLKLLESLRASTLPILWYAIVVEGPQLQLIQCAKQSTMTDTIVLIDPGFCYQVTVQKQPLLLTHPLYDDHPPHLTSVTEVVSLLLDLERYGVCQGLPSQKLSSKVGPVILERASTCDFLVKKNVNICTYCRALHGRVGQIQESSGVI